MCGEYFRLNAPVYQVEYSLHGQGVFSYFLTPLYMALEFQYNKDADGEEHGRKREITKDTKRELGFRVGEFEAGYRGETHTHKIDEERRAVREKVKRTFTIGFTQPEPAHA